MKRREAPFYLRRIKEAMVKFPEIDAGLVENIFTMPQIGQQITSPSILFVRCSFPSFASLKFTINY
jgi:hypothetical protein